MRVAALVVALAAVLEPASGLASPELARSKNCVACHHLERKMIGPAFSAIAARYADDGAAAETLSGRVLGGAVGVWGPTPMPPQGNLSREESDALVRWILAQKEAR